MSLLLAADDLTDRTADVRGPLAALAALAVSLEADLAPLMERDPVVPREKALLSRDGGRCPRHGVPLEFDPYSPDEHRCPRCGEAHRGERHYLWWVMGYQLWLAERAVHAAALHALLGRPALAALSARILDRYSELYLTYPNRDNVLGPARPFFSTYLESIWLLQLCVALDLLESRGGAESLGRTVRDRILEPSSALIASFDEGASNRQVWNNAALLAANLLLGRPADAEDTITGRSGLLSHLGDALLSDGTWYEGENYHLFAHRGLWYGVTMAARAGWTVPPPLARRFDEAFATPFATGLPDFTFPSRRDSQYGVSLRQWRFAESCELGLARRDDPRLVAALAELYGDGAPPGDTGRWRSTAEAERNEPPRALSRADLGWRSLLMARAELPPLVARPSRSVLLESQGLAVLRRDGGRVYAALDYGHPGGGHGHPDRLNVILAIGDERVLDDAGTGSYVDPTLRWYRSTLAHNAPMIDGRSQPPVTGSLRAYDERGAAGWVDAVIPTGGLADGVAVSRTLVAMPDYLIDQIVWEGRDAVRLGLPLHAGGEVRGVGPWRDAPLAGGDAPDDGFDFVRDARVAALEAGSAGQLIPPAAGTAWVMASVPLEWWTALAPGTPADGDQERELTLLRAHATRGVITCLWSWRQSVCEVSASGETLIVRTADGSVHHHSRQDGGSRWHVELHAGGARSSVDLSGWRLPNDAPGDAPPPDGAPAPAPRGQEPLAPALRDVRPGTPQRFHLGEPAYRRSEESWSEAGSPEASVQIAVDGGALVIDVTVHKSELTFRSEQSPDPALDNEDPDIHSDGIQLHLVTPGWPVPAAWLAIPVPDTDRVRLREVAGSHRGVPLRASWARTPGGYSMRLTVPLDALGEAREVPVSLDVLVNDMAAGRQRRRGQLVLSGGGGFVYLQGDRQPPSRYLRFLVARA